MPAETPIPWVLEELARQLAAVVSTMTGADAAVAPEAAGAAGPPDPASAEGAITWVQGFDLAGDTTVVLAAPRETWRMIGAKPLEAAGLSPDEIDDESSRSTFLEILNQTMGALGSQAGGKVKRQVLPRDGREAAAWPEGYTAMPFQITMAGTFPLSFELAAPASWAAALAGSPKAGTALAAAGGAGEGPGDNAGVALAQHSRTFDLLLDVELPVSISFGRALVPLREVAKLTSGSVVELNRTVSDPVEIIVNNCVIARGEVVVIEGNYGVRIQQIISPQERLRTLN